MKTITIIIFILFASTDIKPQSLGFGCLGFVGGFGGYSVQNIRPIGLNEYISEFNESRSNVSTSSMPSFAVTRGFRFGVNFFRTDLDGLVLTAKGYYQKLSQDKISEYKVGALDASSTFQIDITTWGVGIDLGTTITPNFIWKVMDIIMVFGESRFRDIYNQAGASSFIKDYESEGTNISYKLGTGFILNIVSNYVSLEGTVGFSSFNFGRMKHEDGTYLTINENSNVIMEKFITSAGVMATIQLNISFPL